MADMRIRWVLDVVDRGAGKKLLRQDREIRKGLQQTDRAWHKTGAAAASASARQAAAASRVERGVRSVGRAALPASNEVRRYAAAQREALTIGSRIVSQSGRIEQAYKRQGRAASEASRMQKTASGVAKGGGAVAGAAGGLAAKGGGLIAAAGLGVGLAAATGDAVGFEKQMANVQARLLTTGKNMKGLSNFALELGAKTQFSGREAAGAMDELAAQGFSVREIYKTLPGTMSLAAASSTDLATAAEIQTAALRGFGLEASQAGHVADVLAQTTNKSATSMADLGEMLPYVASTAKQTGTSFEQVAAAAGILGNAGIKGSMAGTALRTSMLRLTDPSKKMNDRLKLMGLEAKDLAAVPLPKAIGLIAGGLKKLPTRGAKVGAISAIFGKEAAPAMLNLMSKGQKGIDKMAASLTKSQGAAKRSADIMRNTVAGAWDNFTGSVETASIKLTRRFMPAVKGALNSAAGGVNKAVAAAPAIASGIGAGLRGEAPKGRRRAGGGDDAPTKLQQVGAKIGGVARTIGTAAASAGKQLLDAFRPALPFFQNILLPLLKGIGKGVLGSVVMAFKVLVPIIKIVATAFGFVGKLAKPLKPIFEGLGLVIGFVFAGPILKGIGLLGKLGGVFKIIGPAAKLLAVPVRLVGAAFGFIGRGLSKLPAAFGKLGGILAQAGAYFARFPGRIASFYGRVLTAAGRLVSAAGRALARLPARLAVSAYSAGRAVVDRLAGFAGRAGGAAGRILQKIAGVFGGLGKKIIGAMRSGLGAVLGFFGRVGKSIVDAIVNAIKGAGGAIKKAISGLIPGPVKGALRKAGGAAKGIAGIFREGGLVGGARRPILAAGGEMMIHGGRAGIIGGDPRSDSTLIMAPRDAAIVTGDGQARMAMGEGLHSVLRSQAPHFRKGGRVAAGRYNSTSYGPPWGGIQGMGVTRTGVDLRGGRRVYGAAVDPQQIALGERFYAWPNPFGYSGRFRAFDTGGAIKGRRIDFYDWRGRRHQNGWGKRPVTISSSALRRGGRNIHSAGGGAGDAAEARRLGRSHRRAGLVGDAFSQGITAGQAGLTRREIRRGALGRRGARVNPILDAIAQEQSSGAGSATRSTRAEGRRGGRSRLRAGGGWGGTQNLVMGAIRGLPGRKTYKRSVAVNGNRNSDHNTWIKNAFAADISPGSDRLFGSIGRRLGIRARKGSWNNFPGRPKGFRSQLLWHAPDGSHRDHVHLGIRRMKAGGIVGGLKGAGKKLRAGVGRAMAFRGGSFNRLDEAIGRAADAKIEALRAGLARAVQRGGPKKLVDRMRAVLSAIDFELGRRVGAALDVVAQRTAGIERRRGRTDRSLRRAGVDPESAAGLGAQFRDVGKEVTTRTRSVATLRRALKRARRSGDVEQIRSIKSELAGAQDDLGEAITRRIELFRQAIRAKAQERVDTTQFGLDRAQNTLGRLDALQRLNRTTETPGGMVQRARAIQSTLLPALRAQAGALWGQYGAARKTGDTSGARQAILALDQVGTDIASAMADVADLFRQAAQQAAQDLVDTATHGTSMATLGQQRLELEQRVAGTYDQGGSQRADYIKNTIMPALNAELAALQAQQRVAGAQGDVKLAQQIAEAIAGKQNELLQSQLDAQETIAANTADKRFGGTLGFAFGGETLTDAIIGVGNGS